MGNVAKASSKWLRMDGRYSKFHEKLIKNYNEENDAYFLEVTFQNSEKLHELHKNKNWKSRKSCY